MPHIQPAVSGAFKKCSTECNGTLHCSCSEGGNISNFAAQLAESCHYLGAKVSQSYCTRFKYCLDELCSINLDAQYAVNS